MKTHVIDYERGGSHAFSQVESEFKHLEEIARGCKSILEIGSLYGGSALRLGNAMPEGSRLVCVDVGYEKMKSTWITLPSLIYKLESLENRDVHLIIGDSMDPRTIDAVGRLGPYDLIFIDGGHTHDNVAADWRNYQLMGKIIAFHDIQSNAGAHACWKEIRKLGRHAEYIDGDTAGIGVYWKS